MSPADLAVILARHHVRREDLATMGARTTHRRRRAAECARNAIIRAMAREGAPAKAVGQVLGLPIATVRDLAAKLYLDLGRAPVATGHMLPIAGERRDCGSYAACLNAHVAAHPKGDDVPASCPKACWWWTPEQGPHPHAYASSGRANMEGG